jgi:hypothetical protein
MSSLCEEAASLLGSRETLLTKKGQQYLISVSTKYYSFSDTLGRYSSLVDSGHGVKVKLSVSDTYKFSLFLCECIFCVLSLLLLAL